MPDKDLTIVSCVPTYTGVSKSNGKQFTIYTVEATDANGVSITHKLTSFEHLPPGRATYDVKPYMKNGIVESYTVASKRSGGGGGGGSSAALKSEVDLLVARVEFLEGKLREWAPLMTAVQTMLHQQHQTAPPAAPAPQPQPQPVGGGRDLDDIPF